MADTKAPAAKGEIKAQGAVKAPETNGNVEAPKKEKKERVKLQEVFASADEAKKAAEDRTKGPRRAFTCAFGGKEYYVVANNEGRAGGIAFAQLGGTVTEAGGKARKAKTVSADGILAAISALPDEQKNAILAQLKTLAGGK